ncbi:MAG TPA: hypothetical protein VF101_05645 [Gaiellaceae bacterium]
MADRSDTQPPEPSRRDPDLWFLPEIARVEAVRRRYDEPRYRVRDGELEEVYEAVEVTVETSEPFPQRALGPVLFVGPVELSESEQIGPARYRFYGYDVERLKDDAPIRLGWFGQPRPKGQTDLRFSLVDTRDDGRGRR